MLQAKKKNHKQSKEIVAVPGTLISLFKLIVGIILILMFAHQQCSYPDCLFFLFIFFFFHTSVMKNEVHELQPLK